jgi:Holliday junction resolvasome RuvABC endonuclease subunit
MALAMKLPVLLPVNVSSAKKSFASDGHASKARMIAAATMRYGVTLPEHAADACAIAHTALQRGANGR